MEIILEHRVFYNTWRDVNRCEYRALKSWGALPLVRRLVVYRKDGYDMSPIRVLPWSLEMHKFFFSPYSPQKFHENLDEYEHLSLELKAYLKIRDRVFHCLVAGEKSIPEVKKMVEESQWMAILKKYPGRVDPAVFFHLGAPNPLVALAKVLFGIHQQMKKTRKIWLAQQDVEELKQPHLKNAFIFAFQAGFVTMKMDAVAMNWALEATREEPPLVHKPGIVPVAWDEWDGETLGYDCTMPPDGFIDNGKLPVTFLKVVPGPEVEFIPCPEGGIGSIREELDLDHRDLRVLMVATNIHTHVNLEPLRATIVQTQVKFGPIPAGKVCVLRFKSGMYELSRGEEMTTITNEEAFNYTTPACSCRFQDLPVIPSRSYDRVVVLCGSLPGEYISRWAEQCFRVGKGAKTCLFVRPKRL